MAKSTRGLLTVLAGVCLAVFVVVGGHYYIHFKMDKALNDEAFIQRIADKVKEQKPVVDPKPEVKPEIKPEVKPEPEPVKTSGFEAWSSNWETQRTQ